MAKKFFETVGTLTPSKRLRGSHISWMEVVEIKYHDKPSTWNVHAYIRGYYFTVAKDFAQKGLALAWMRENFK